MRKIVRKRTLVKWSFLIVSFLFMLYLSCLLVLQVQKGTKLKVASGSTTINHLSKDEKSIVTKQQSPMQQEHKRRNTSLKETSLPTKTLEPLIDKKNRTLILFWNHPWGVASMGFKEGYNMGGCVATNNRKLLPQAGAVVFHFTNLPMERDRPWMHYRDPNQLFVFYSLESPSWVKNAEGRHAMRVYGNDFINWTFTHRRDSDVFYPYPDSAGLKSIIESGKSWVDQKLARKRKMAIWVVSNCNTIYGTRMRLVYINALVNAGLSVDRYGRCFNNKLQLQAKTEDQLDTYKFYMAFENTRYCKDYVTEKFWNNSLLHGRVPVVWGASKRDLTELAPTGSFIHTDDFDSPTSLAKYLNYLHSNDTAYREYFRWIEEPDERTLKLAELYAETGDVRLCRLMLSNRKRKSYSGNSFDRFYYDESYECLREDCLGARAIPPAGKPVVAAKLPINKIRLPDFKRLFPLLGKSFKNLTIKQEIVK
ncbi:alpha-(1,3)-fucosyltransferase 7-like [Clavelina lepadiformis]|uniref:alpha-(1,3)-fucosyltransferase 7-like n=1 Tax=Clavelina lepadiformis TaxID=159417 RepID=UPI004041AD89